MRTSFLVSCLAVCTLGCSDYNINHGPDPVARPDGSSTTPIEDVSTLPDPSYETPRDETEQVDRVVQPAEFAVDVLWVVDNSCSMEDDQDSLAAAFPTFIDAFLAMQGIDYHVGVISTDMSDSSHQGRLREAQGVRWLEVDTTDPYGKFDTMARMGIDGEIEETGRATSYHALSTHRNGHNAGFLRDEAALAIVVISDEEDKGSMWGVPLDDYIDFLLNLKYDPALVSFSTIVGPTPGGCSTAEAGAQYEAVRQAIGGVFHSICDANWVQILDEIAANAASLRREFFLDEIPIVDSLQMWVIEEDGTEIDFVLDVDFTYNAVRNSVQLTSYTPGPYAEIFVAYDIDWGASP